MIIEVIRNNICSIIGFFFQRFEDQFKMKFSKFYKEVYYNDSNIYNEVDLFFMFLLDNKFVSDKYFNESEKQ